MNTELATIYHDYIACLNRQDWLNLGRFVDDKVVHNDRRMGLSGYVQMLAGDFDHIPDLHFDVSILLADPPYLSSRLLFNCTPRGMFLGVAVDGRRVTFTENVIYLFENGKIIEVWSVIDKTAIEAALLATGTPSR